MPDEIAPWRLKRHGSQSTYDVLDGDGVIVGTIFHYLGAWWANSASLISNRCGSKNDAADLAWEQSRVRR